MNKEKTISELDRLVEEMEPFFRYLKRGTVDAFKNSLKSTDYRELRNLLRWLQALYDVEHTALKKAWELVPPSMWESYKLHGIKGLQEQLILANAVSEWKQTWEQHYAVETAEIPEPVPDQGIGHVVQTSERQVD